MYLFGIPGVLFLALAVLFGYTLLRALRLPLRGLETIAAAPVVGIVIAAWLCLLPYLLTGSLDAGMIVASLVMLAAIAWLKPPLPAAEREHLPFVIAIVLVSFIFMFMGLYLYYDGEYHAAYPFYGDAAFHAAMMNSFSQGYNYPPAYPMMAGQPLRYTFLIDFYSAALDRLGLGLEWSIVLPGWLLLSGLLSLIYFAGVRFTGRRAGGAISVVLLALSGGLGFAVAARDWLNSGTDILSFIAYHNLNYTTVWTDNLVFTNFIVIVMAQRTALVGFAAGALVMLLLYARLVQREGRAEGLIMAGVLAGLLPMFHAYSYAAIMLSSALLLLVFRERKWYYFMIPAIFLAIPQALWIESQMGTSHFKVQPGWMAGSLANIPWFWFANMGVGLLLLIAGFFIVSRRNKAFYLPFLAIFVMANLFVFQPWDYDNHKFFSFWLMPSVLLMSAFLLYVLDLRRADKPLFAVLLALSVLTGALVAVFIVGHPYVELNKAELYVGSWIEENTPKDAVFLTSDWPIHPVTTVAGRKSFLGYTGWLYTHGINFSDRLSAEKRIYAASNETEALSLLNQSGVGYVFIGPSEMSSGQYSVNQRFFASRLECIFNWTDPDYGNNYRIYKV